MRGKLGEIPFPSRVKLAYSGFDCDWMASTSSSSNRKKSLRNVWPAAFWWEIGNSFSLLIINKISCDDQLFEGLLYDTVHVGTILKYSSESDDLQYHPIIWTDWKRWVNCRGEIVRVFQNCIDVQCDLNSDYSDNIPIKISISVSIISSWTLFLDNILDMIFQIIFCRKVFITMITEIIWPSRRS